MKNARLTLIVLALVSATWAATADLTGTWKAMWLEGGLPNTIKLTDTKGDVSGTYTADSGEACPVDGTNLNRKVALHVQCSKWDIQMNGMLTDDSTIEGTYTAYGNAVGKFKMEKNTCWLPEGCK